jgi:hypothetical protein
MRLQRPDRGTAAFTIAECLVACLVIGAAFGAMAVASVTLQKSLYSAKDYSSALNAQTRITDYLRRDLRNALDAGVQAGGKEVWADLPDDYDAAGNPVDPTVGPNQTVVYTTPGARMRVRYYKDGANFVRDASGVKTVIAAKASDFEQSFAPVPAVGPVTGIALTLTYAGKFGAGASKDAIGRKATELRTVLSLRNKPAPLATPPPTPTVPKGKRKGR